MQVGMYSDAAAHGTAPPCGMSFSCFKLNSISVIGQLAGALASGFLVINGAPVVSARIASEICSRPYLPDSDSAPRRGRPRRAAGLGRIHADIYIYYRNPKAEPSNRGRFPRGPGHGGLQGDTHQAYRGPFDHHGTARSYFKSSPSSSKPG